MTMKYLPMPVSRTLFVLLSVIMLVGCRAESPSERWELAAQGIYHGSLGDNGEHLVIGSIYHGASHWQTKPLARQFNWNHDTDQFTEVLYTAYAANGEYALTADYHTLTLWDTDNGESVWYWSAPARIEAVDLSADGQLALLGLASNRAVLFDVVNGGVLREFRHEGPVISVSLSGDSTRALTGSENHIAKLWDIGGDRLLQRYELTNQVTLVKLNNNGSLALLAPAREQAQLWNTSTQNRVSYLPTEDFLLYRARFEPKDQILLGTTYGRVLQFSSNTGQRTGQWQIGSFWQGNQRSTTALDMTWRNDRLWVLGSDGYLYSF